MLSYSYPWGTDGTASACLARHPFFCATARGEHGGEGRSCGGVRTRTDRPRQPPQASVGASIPLSACHTGAADARLAIRKARLSRPFLNQGALTLERDLHAFHARPFCRMVQVIS